MQDCLDFSSDDVTRYGLNVFVAMSTRHFEFMLTDLGCTFTYDDRLRQIAREFVEEAFPAIGISTPYTNIERDSDDLELYLKTWRTAFDKLDSIGYAEEICNWIKKLRVEKLNNIHPRSDTGPPFWLLADWSMERWIAPSLDLADEKILKIKVAILQLLVYYSEWYPRLKKAIQDIDFDEWEEFAYEKQGGKNWMSIQLGFHNRFSMWIKIFNILSNEEIIIFSLWWYKSMQSYDKYFDPNTHIDLEQFALDLRKLGYISITDSKEE